MTKHWKTGSFAGFDKDHTIKTFKKTGIYDAVVNIGNEMDAKDRIHITTFREDGWRRHEFLAEDDENLSKGTHLSAK